MAKQCRTPHPESQYTTNQIVELSSLPPDYIPAEQNLENIGYFSAGYKRKFPTTLKEAKTINLVSSGIERQIKIIPSSYGYPNSEDFDLYRAFLKVCYEHTQTVGRFKNGEWRLHPEIKVPIAFSTLKLLRFAGYKKNQDALLLVRDWTKRGVVTGIQGRLYDAKTGQFQERTVTLFSDARTRGETLRNGRIAERNYVWPSPWFLSNIYYFYTRRVDIAFHRRLRRPIAKILYPLLDTGWYASGGTTWAKRYSDLCAILFIRCYTHVSQVADQLDPSHEELQREQFLDRWSYEKDENYRWTGVIRWWPGKKWFTDQEERHARKDLLDDGSSLSLITPSLASEARETSRVEKELRDSEKSDAAQLRKSVARFYEGIGQARISQQKTEKGVRVLADLIGQGFSIAEIDCAIGWTLSRHEHFPQQLFSIAILPQVIGQALQDNRVSEKKPDRVKQEEADREQETDKRLHIQQAALYASLSAEEQTAFVQLARKNLLQQGFRQEFLLEPLVRAEVFRLIGERQEALDQGEADE